jgi:hypothetical protein
MAGMSGHADVVADDLLSAVRLILRARSVTERNDALPSEPAAR